MQGWKRFIATEQKVQYINALLEIGYDTIDFGSFVSPKAIPQMADTHEVITRLKIGNTDTRLLAIVANERGAMAAADYDAITFLGFPFSISETFQQRNTNSSIDESLRRVESIQRICMQKSKQLVIYISMGFGNPYGDEYSEEIVYRWANIIAGMGIKIISLADTVGLATAQQVGDITRYLVQLLPDTVIGVHLHSAVENRQQKTDAALQAGCTRFDGALKGIGGCPMAGDTLIGNIDTEWMINYFNSLKILQPINEAALHRSLQLAAEVFVI